MESKHRGAASGQRFDEVIPDKRYFRIGEVADLVGVHAHVLRYWEKEVASIRPGKSSSNQRRYRRRDVEIFREIRRLLYSEGYTLSGAKKRLQTQGRPMEEGRDLRAFPEVSSDSVVEQTSKKVESAMAQVKVQKIPQGQEAPSDQMNLKFRVASAEEKLVRVKNGLNEILLLAGEQP